MAMNFTTYFYIDLGNGLAATEATITLGNPLALITIEDSLKEFKARLDLQKKIFIDYPFQDVDSVAVDSIINQIRGDV